MLVARFFAYFTVIGSAICLSLGLVQYQRFTVKQQSLKHSEVLRVNLAAKTMAQQIQRVVADINILASSESVSHYRKADNAQNAKSLQQRFISFLNSVRIYDQVRLLDTTGHELIRVNYNNGQPSVVPTDQLQNKSQRYYFSRALDLKPDQFYISRLDLNVEHSQIELPFKPTLRIATPLVDVDNKVWGVLLLNYLAANLLTDFKYIMSESMGESMLVNNQGYWLSSPNPEDEWLFMWNGERNFAKVFPFSWPSIITQGSGQIQTENGLFISTTIRFDQVIQGSDIVVDNNEFWIAVTRLPPSMVSFSLLTIAQQHPLVLTILFVATFLLSGLLAWLRTMVVNKTEELKHSEWSLSQAQRIAQLGNWQWNITTGVLTCSVETLRILGLEELCTAPTNAPFLESTHPEDFNAVVEAVNDAVKTHHGYSINHRILQPDGNVCYVQTKGNVQVDRQGKVANLVGTIQDVSDRTAAEAAMQESNRRYRNLFSNMAEGYALQRALFDQDHNVYDFIYLEVNPAFERILGVSRKDYIGKTLKQLVPNAEDYWLSTFAQVATSGQAMRLEGFGQSFGRHFEIMASCPEIGYVAVLFSDITERIQQKEQLQQASIVFESTTEGVVIADAEKNIELVNQAFTDISGYSFEEVIGKHFLYFTSTEQGQDVILDIMASLERDGRWQGEMCNLRRGQRAYPAWQNISVVKDSKGNISKYVLVLSDISPLKEAQAQLRHLAHHDVLTGLPNRFVFNANLNQALERAKRNRFKVALLYIDLDRFKTTNDTLGHTVGDRLLKYIALKLKRRVRAEDLVARLGGDEFVIILDDINQAEDAATLAEKLLPIFNRPIRISNHDIISSTSIGISIYPDDAKNAEALIRAADAAMYRAKSRGKNRYDFYTAELTRRAEERLSIEKYLHQALTQEEFSIYFQPQFLLPSMQLIGFEALLRWQHPTKGLLLPEKFISIAEECGLIEEISAWVMDEVLHQASLWLKQGYKVPRLAINLSGHVILYDHTVNMVKNALHKHQVSTSVIPLEFEITETILQSGEHVISTLSELREMNIKIGIDDFGTGYSSLGQLKNLPIDTLKIDKVFLNLVPEEKDNVAIINAIVSMGHSLGLRVIAEGIESEAQLELLTKLGCDEAQGFMLGLPQSVEATTGLLQKQPNNLRLLSIS